MEHFFVCIQFLLIHHPVAAPIIFIAVHTFMAVFFLPCSPMTLMAGALWGGSTGMAVSICAAMVSSATTFCLSRSFLHSKIEKFLLARYPKVAGLLGQVTIHDWKIIALSQLNPLIPSSTMGYVFGLSRVTFGRYFLFSGIFMLPLQLLFVITGHSVKSLLTTEGHWYIALATIVLVAIFILFSKRIYRVLCQLFGVNNGV
ncbi:MAG: TVP38/TMEM64 family protein [Chlorobium sp.]|nr:TVP38/TMEM64 family protein [Chlorobium sp.]